MASDNERSENSLGPTGTDYVASAVKAALGAVPFAGSLLSELAGSIIPNQRVDRLAKFASELESRITKLDTAHVRDQMHDEAFTDLFEETVRQAARSTSDARREYLASILSNGLSSEAISHTESKHLLRILGEINDAEIIWLRLYAAPGIGEDKDFRDLHTAVLTPVRAHMGSSREEFDKHALQESYKDHLTSLGLLERKYAFDPKSRQPQIDPSTGGQKTAGFRITILGRLLLRQIGMLPERKAKP